MSRIDEPPNRPRIRSKSAPADGGARADELGDPITARLEGRPVDGAMAPMLPDLLTRPEAISGRAEAAGLRPPEPADAVDPPSPTEELQVLRRLESKLGEVAGRLREGDRAEAVDSMVESLRHFRRLREEVVMRSEV